MNGFGKVYTEFFAKRESQKSTDLTWANNNQLKIDWLSFYWNGSTIYCIALQLILRLLRLAQWNGFAFLYFVLTFVCNSMQILASLHVHYHLFMKIVFICVVLKCEFVNLDHFFNDLFMDMLCHRSHLPPREILRTFPYLWTKQNAVHCDHCFRAFVMLCKCVSVCMRDCVSKPCNPSLIFSYLIVLHSNSNQSAIQLLNLFRLNIHLILNSMEPLDATRRT